MSCSGDVKVEDLRAAAPRSGVAFEEDRGAEAAALEADRARLVYLPLWT